MGEVKSHLEGRSKQERARARQNLGTLRDLTVQPKTRKRYTDAREKFYAYLRTNDLSTPTQALAFDELLADYIEFLWSTGEGRSLGQ